MTKPMMKCGHAANATDSEGNPVCAICYGINPQLSRAATEVAEKPPDLEGRRARCAYYGSSFQLYGRFSCSCRTCEKRYEETGKKVCLCERDSDPDLPFFMHRPDQDYDEFYCGCHSWS
jgi:hypothetical protein